MRSKKGEMTLSISLMIKLAYSAAVFVLLFVLFVSLWALIFGGDTKDDATAENVLEEVANLINSKGEGPWETKTFIKFAKDEYALVGFSAGVIQYPNFADNAGKFKAQFRNSNYAQICLYGNPSADKPTLMNCEILSGIEQISYSYDGNIQDEFFFIMHPKDEISLIERGKEYCLSEIKLIDKKMNINRISC